jgi:hypothetical protein
MDDAEIAAELEAIQERLARIVDALKARSAPGTPADPESLRSISRITTEELDALTNEELRRLSEGDRPE